MSREQYVDEIEFIARSYNRVYILSLLSEHEQLEKDQIKEHCTEVRTTLQRNLDALEEQGWIQCTNTREYRITPCGGLIAEAFEYLVDAVETADKLNEFLRWIPNDSFDLDPRLLADAQVTVSDPHNPYSTVNEHIRVLKNTEEFKGLLPIVGREALEVRWRQHKDNKAWDDIVVSVGAAEVLTSDENYTDLLREVLDSKRAHIFVFDGEIPYFVGIYDDRVQIGVEDEEGIPRALVESDSADVREWAEQKFDQYRERSRPIRLH